MYYDHRISLFNRLVINYNVKLAKYSFASRGNKQWSNKDIVQGQFYYKSKF